MPYKDSFKICNIQWKELKKVVMGDQEFDCKQIKYKLNDVEKILLQRYIDAETKEPNFIENGNSKNYVREIFFFVYYAGHGCADVNQYLVLNEKEAEKIFWPVEDYLRRLGRKCGG
jgi:hypothetical protein